MSALEDRIAGLLEQVRRGEVTVAEAVGRLRSLPFEDLGFAKVDHHRELRRGFPEVIFCEGKTPEQVREIAVSLAAGGNTVLATRASRGMFEAVQSALPDTQYHETARIIVVPGRRPAGAGEDGSNGGGGVEGLVLIVAAGTSDIPVAEEAAVTAEALGARTERLYDVGVSGLHRLLAHRHLLDEARAIVAVAGMDGVLPSIVGGLVAAPVIAVPTSIGYGSSFEGLAALLTMLNSCASGVAVVNIDNGFGAGYMAAVINSRTVAPGKGAAPRDAAQPAAPGDSPGEWTSAHGGDQT